MDEMPIKAIEERTVTVVCNNSEGNFEAISKVRWFLDGELLKELPECSYTSFDVNGNGEGAGGPLCNVDPHIISLKNVSEIFADYRSGGNADVTIILDPPSPAMLQATSTNVVKGSSVTLSCSVDNPGKPDVLTYVWYRGTKLVSDINTHYWTINPVVFETEDNYTCYASNEGGNSDPASISINVLAPPKFVQDLPSYLSILHTTKNISLTCRVECSPICSISWSKNGILIPRNASRFSFRETTHPSDRNKNLFESIESTLIWKVDYSLSKGLDNTIQVSTYTCQSSSNGVGSPVVSRTTIGVEYRPENLPMSNIVVDIQEDGKTEIIKCKRKDNPKPIFFLKNERGEIVSNNHTLSLNDVSRDAEAYYCEAYNRYGTFTTNTYLNVQFPIEVKGLVGSEVTLPCNVDTQSCGELRSIKFSKNASTIFVYNHADGTARGEGDAETRAGFANICFGYRMKLEYKPGSSHAQLVIRSVEVGDEGSYKCLEVRENCNVEQIMTVSMLVKPNFVQISQNGSRGNSSWFGPYNEGTNIELKCEARGGMPIPKVTFYSNNKIVKYLITSSIVIVTASYEAVQGDNGIGTGITKLHVRLAREHLKGIFTCVVESDALDEPLVETINADVNGQQTIGLEAYSAFLDPPEVIVSPEIITTNEKAVVLLKCAYHSNPTQLTDFVWTKNGKNLTLYEPKYLSSNFSTLLLLIISNISRDDHGNYTCICRNSAGWQESTNVFLNVQYPPTAELVIVEKMSVKSVNKKTFNMICNIKEGNPQVISKVRWYYNGEFLAEVLKCNPTNANDQGRLLCVGKPNVLILRRVRKAFAGNYTCMIENDAGWGPMSPPLEILG
ncbi:contactin 5 [Holotrichia oblita]|uniref:Contactin 5 n=1 Tax=Holotrichia oblita TaxID=644536 RepID=A0ACB9TXN0_HOLOL|nr:contactin 5 [Holotrichia oblita]